MSNGKRSKVTLHEQRTADGGSRLLQASIEPNGDLVVEGHDLGAEVRQVWGSSEYEYSRRIKRAYLPKMLLALISDRSTATSR